MDILTPQQMTERLDYQRPLHPPATLDEDSWPIPFEYGPNNPKGTRITLMLAKLIAAELQAAVAVEEQRRLSLRLKQEQQHNKEQDERMAAQQREVFEAKAEIASLKRAQRDLIKAQRGKGEKKP